MVYSIHNILNPINQLKKEVIMKSIKYSILLLGTVFMCLSEGFSQIKPEDWKPIIISPTSHDPDFKSRLKNTSTQSFYKSKENWQYIIDTTWGPGQPLSDKLNVFDTYTNALTTGFIGFHTLGINETEWDSIVSDYRSKINDSTSRGAFAALMGRLAYNLYDSHTRAFDTVVFNSPVYPGTPVFNIS